MDSAWFIHSKKKKEMMIKRILFLFEATCIWVLIVSFIIKECHQFITYSENESSLQWTSCSCWCSLSSKSHGLLGKTATSVFISPLFLQAKGMFKLVDIMNPIPVKGLIMDRKLLGFNLLLELDSVAGHLINFVHYCSGTIQRKYLKPFENYFSYVTVYVS